jgi:hypothetical protein
MASFKGCSLNQQTIKGAFKGGLGSKETSNTSKKST